MSTFLPMASSFFVDPDTDTVRYVIISLLYLVGAVGFVLSLKWMSDAKTARKGIFAGEIANWSEVGGPDEVITVVAREEGSGTRAAFEELVMEEEGLILDSAVLLPSNGAVRTTVSTTPNSIGFLSFGYLDDTTKPVAVNGVLPTVENAASGEYAVVRPLNMVTNGQPGALAGAFLEYIMSADGQRIVADEGYIPIS